VAQHVLDETVRLHPLEDAEPRAAELLAPWLTALGMVRSAFHHGWSMGAPRRVRIAAVVVLAVAPWTVACGASSSPAHATGDAGASLDAGGDASSPQGDAGPGVEGGAGGCVMTFSGALTASFPCSGTAESAGTVQEIVLSFDQTGYPQGAINGMQLVVDGALSATTYTQAQLDMFSCSVQDTAYAPPVTDAGFGGFALWSCQAGGEACPALSLTLTSVDTLTTGQSVPLGPSSNTHGSFDATLPDAPCSGCTSKPVGSLTVHATF
jgi:hypothetical protein